MWSLMIHHPDEFAKYSIYNQVKNCIVTELSGRYKDQLYAPANVTNV